jgi:hypothetical protein
MCRKTIAFIVTALLLGGPMSHNGFQVNAAERTSQPGAALLCDLPTPGGTPEDANMAFFNPDEYAWKLFLSLNRQGSANDPGVPDPKHKNINEYEDDKSVVWETWALASGGRSGPFRRTIPNRSEIYLDKGAKPLEWGKWDRSDGKAKHLEPFQTEDPSSFGSLASNSLQISSSAKVERG